MLELCCVYIYIYIYIYTYIYIYNIYIYISYALSPWLRKLNTDFTLKNCLFGSLKLTKNADPDKYKYSSYSIGFDSRSEFPFPDGTMAKNVIIFRADVGSSVPLDYEKKGILILGEATQGLDDATLTAEAKCPINFTQPNKRFVLSLHYNGINSILFINATKIYQFKAEDFVIKDYALYLGHTLNDFTINNMKKARLKEIAKFFSVDFNFIDTNNILDIYRYLLKGK